MKISPPPPQPQDARQNLLESIPFFKRLSEDYLKQKNNGVSAIVLHNLGLKHQSTLDRNSVLFCLSLAIGYPTPTEAKTQSLLWDVRPRVITEKNYYPTFSEKQAPADFHTDSSFHAKPEEDFVLYSVQPSLCGAGLSQLVTVDSIVKSLQQTAEGRAALEILSNSNFPFRVPTLFTKTGKPDQIEIFNAPLLSDANKKIRYRYDSIKKGIEASSLTTDEKEKLLFALDALDNTLKYMPIPEFQLESDSAVLVDNLTCLHGRTDFNDPERHLIRVRISQNPDQKHFGT